MQEKYSLWEIYNIVQKNFYFAHQITRKPATNPFAYGGGRGI